MMIASLKALHRKLDYKALWSGFLAGYCAYLIIQFAVAVAFTSIDARHHAHFHHHNPELIGNPSYMYASLLVGVISYLIGGFIAGRLAERHPLYTAVMAGVATIAFDLVVLPWLQPVPLWYNLLDYSWTLPAFYLGGHLAIMHAQGKKD